MNKILNAFDNTIFSIKDYYEYMINKKYNLIYFALISLVFAVSCVVDMLSIIAQLIVLFLPFILISFSFSFSEKPVIFKKRLRVYVASSIQTILVFICSVCVFLTIYILSNIVVPSSTSSIFVMIAFITIFFGLSVQNVYLLFSCIPFIVIFCKREYSFFKSFRFAIKFTKKYFFTATLSMFLLAFLLTPLLVIARVSSLTVLALFWESFILTIVLHFLLFYINRLVLTDIEFEKPLGAFSFKKLLLRRKKAKEFANAKKKKCEDKTKSAKRKRKGKRKRKQDNC